MMLAPRIHVVGPSFFDMIFSDLPEEPRLGTEVYCKDLVLCPGGVTTTAIALARLGAVVSVGTVLGDDLFGNYLLRQFKHEGVGIDDAQTCAGWATPITVSLARLGDRALITHLPEPEHDALPPLSLDGTADADAVFAAMPVPQQSWYRLVGVERGPRRCFVDLGWTAKEETLSSSLERILPAVAGLLPNEAEALRYTASSEITEALSRFTKLVPLVVAKLGPKGAVALRQGDDGPTWVPGLTVSACDTTGAGDIFDAGFLFGHVSGVSLKAAMTLGVVAAGLSVQHLGSSLSAPCWKEVVAYLACEESSDAVDRASTDEIVQLLQNGTEREPCQRSYRRICATEIGGLL